MQRASSHCEPSVKPVSLNSDPSTYYIFRNPRYSVTQPGLATERGKSRLPRRREATTLHINIEETLSDPPFLGISLVSLCILVLPNLALALWLSHDSEFWGPVLHRLLRELHVDTLLTEAMNKNAHVIPCEATALTLRVRHWK